MIFLTRRMLTHCRRVRRCALTKSSPRWCPTSCSLILPRLRCSGVYPLDSSIRSRLVLLVLVLRVRAVRDLGVYIDTDVTMSAHVTAIAERVLMHSVKYAVCVVRW